MTERERYVTNHRNRERERITGEPTSGSPWSTGERWCWGAVRSLYTRVGKRWAHAGWTCLKCGATELEALVDGRSWRREPGVERAGVLEPSDDTGAIADVSTPSGSAGVDTDELEARALSAATGLEWQVLR